MKTTIRHNNLEFTFTDEDVVNYDDLLFEIGTQTNHCLWLLHDHGFTLGVICAANLQDALDIAADEGILDRFKLPNEIVGICNVAHLGNNCQAYDIESLGFVQFDIPSLSLTRLCGETIETAPCPVGWNKV